KQKMATESVEGGGELIANCTLKTMCALTEACKGNGMNHNCYCGQKSGKSLDTVHLKIARQSKTTNGLAISIKSANSTTIPNLRSRNGVALLEKQPSPPASPRKRRSLRIEKIGSQDSMVSCKSPPAATTAPATASPPLHHTTTSVATTPPANNTKSQANTKQHTNNQLYHQVTGIISEKTTACNKTPSCNKTSSCNKTPVCNKAPSCNMGMTRPTELITQPKNVYQNQPKMDISPSPILNQNQPRNGDSDMLCQPVPIGATKVPVVTNGYVAHANNLQKDTHSFFKPLPSGSGSPAINGLSRQSSTYSLTSLGSVSTPGTPISGFLRQSSVSSSGCSTPHPIFSNNYSNPGTPCSSSQDEDTKDSISTKDIVTCKWQHCNTTMDIGSLVEHMRETHVRSQKSLEKCVCLWEGCKVYNRPSSAKSWLDRHILSHSGDKPFRCIVTGCKMRYTSQSALERHVNSHFNASQPANGQRQKPREDTPSKLLRKKRLKQGFRRKVPKKSNDFFDAHVMEGIRYDLGQFMQKTKSDVHQSGNTISVTFHSTMQAKRTDKDGNVNVLLRWKPENVIPDEWVQESQVTSLSKRTIRLRDLPRHSITNLDASLYRTHRHRKHRRK
ncbi:unnamed protein product, partial [Owenia fusiformis]